MKADTSEVSPARHPSSENGPIATAWAQFQELRQADSRGTSDTAPSFSVPGYRLLREIHRGGQGIVYQAIQESTRRKVAIKVLKEGPLADSREFARFDREVDILSRINHPHIVAIHDRGLAAGHAYYTMDYIAGQSLDVFVAGAPRNIDETLRLFIKVCDAVNVAHLRGVIHRDLKPANIRVDEEGEPRVLDFGLAKLARESGDGSLAAGVTITGQFVGSLPWASPEQAAGESDALDIRTDVYSLGVILYQLLSGRFPYPVSGRIDDVIRHISGTNPVRLSTQSRRIDQDLELIVLKCLEKEPARRYQSAGDLARDIRSYLADEPVSATSPSAWYRLRKFARRNRGPVIAGISVTIALMAGVAGLTIGLLQARIGQREAKEQAEQVRSVNDFLRDILTQVNPDTHGADVRMIDVLADASATAAKHFAGRPLQEALAHELLAEVYHKLTLWPEVKREYGIARGLRENQAGPDDPAVLVLSVNYLNAVVALDQLVEAEQLLHDIVPRLERVFGPDDPRTLGARGQIAWTYMRRGNVDDAERLLLELKSHPRLAENDERQINILRLLIQIQNRRLGVNPETIRPILARSEPLAREAVERSIRHSGAESANTLEFQIALASIMERQGHCADSARICRDVLAKSERRFGECHRLRQNALPVLARALAALGEDREPGQLHLRRLTCLRRTSEPGSIVLVGALSDALRYLERAGLAAEGEAAARELVGLMEPYGAQREGHLFDARSYVARFVSMQGRFDEADALFAELQARVSRGDVPRARIARLHLFYGQHLTARGLFADAESELLKAVSQCEDIRKGTLQTHPDDIILGFLKLYEAWGKPDKIAEYQDLRSEIMRLPVSE